MAEIGLVAEAADAGAGPGAEGDAALDGGADEAGQDGGGLSEWVGGRLVIFRLELAAGEEPSDPGADGGQDVCHLVIAWWGRGVKDERPGARLAEDPVQHQGMKVDEDRVRGSVSHWGAGRSERFGAHLGWVCVCSVTDAV
jgi:hypothetical protein